MKNVFINILTITGGITLFSLFYKCIRNIFRDKLDTARIEGWNNGYHEGYTTGFTDGKIAKEYNISFKD